MKRPRTIGKKKVSGNQGSANMNKKIGGGKGKKGKENSTNERPPPVGFE